MRTNRLVCMFLFYIVITACTFYKILSTKSTLPVEKTQTGDAADYYSEYRPHHGELESVHLNEIEEKYWNQWAPPVGVAHRNTVTSLGRGHRLNYRISSNTVNNTVSIWSNNGLGEYLWQHILHGRLRPAEGGIYKFGEKTINQIKYRYKQGNLDVGIVPDTTENAILVLNGRDNTTVNAAIQWLNELPNIPALENVGLVLIGDEQCKNDWIKPYLTTANKTALRFVFVVYDTPIVDDKIVFQFPLGVAVYRGFPLPMYPDLAVPGSRTYVCNFIGTVYTNSSRQILAKIVQQLKQTGIACYLKIRDSWLPTETSDSLTSYHDVLKSSDLTLCPIGFNSESYRIYEAMSVGSIPVIEDKAAPGSCDNRAFRLLKDNKAPVLFIKDWSTDLPSLIHKEDYLTLAEKENRRKRILYWYHSFTKGLGKKFVEVVNSKFFSKTPVKIV